MRRIYLIRHAAPAFPGGQRVCLSRTDLPLSPEGVEQGEQLGACFREVELSGVYASPLQRAVETARFLSEAVIPREGLEELGVGSWEGLSFQTIRQQDPVLYQRRGEDPIRHLIPGGEPPPVCRARAMAALTAILRETEGDVAAVSHAGVNRLLLCAALDRDLKEFLTIPQPYGCINILRQEEGELKVEAIGLTPEQFTLGNRKGGLYLV